MRVTACHTLMSLSLQKQQKSKKRDEVRTRLTWNGIVQNMAAAAATAAEAARVHWNDSNDDDDDDERSDCALKMLNACMRRLTPGKHNSAVFAAAAAAGDGAGRAARAASSWAGGARAAAAAFPLPHPSP